MRTKNWFKTSPYWFKGGAIGAGICVALFVFYIFVWFPVVDHVYVEQIARSGSTPAWTTNIPMFTGHLFSLFSGFFLMGGAGICPQVVPECVEWRVESGCVQQIMTATPACSDFVMLTGSYLACLILIIIYTLVGALIGLIYGKFKNRKIHS